MTARPDYAEAWDAAVGTPWTLTDGVSAVVAMKSMPRNKQPTWQLINRNTVEFWQAPAHIQDLRWRSRHKIKGELHRWDMRAAYLNAAALVDLPYGPLRPGLFSTTAVGYYQIRITAPQARQLHLPPPDRKGLIWVTHSMLPLLTHVRHELVDSWQSPDSGRILRSWAENWRDLLVAHPALRVPLKRGYAEAFGLMGAKTTGIYRPDWRHMIIDKVRASLITRLQRVETAHSGLRPYRVDVDSVWYDLPDGLFYHTLGETLGVGDKIGQMRYEGSEQTAVKR
jgi:hypothetical protein